MHEMNWHHDSSRALFGIVTSNAGVSKAITEAEAAGVSPGSIFATIMQFVLQLLSGKPLDLQAIIAAILALIPAKP